MQRRDWWLGVGILALVLIGQEAFPRYDIRLQTPLGQMLVFERVDRWRGRVEIWIVDDKFDRPAWVLPMRQAGKRK